MSQAGARSPASPPKPASPSAQNAATPRTPEAMPAKAPSPAKAAAAPIGGKATAPLAPKVSPQPAGTPPRAAQATQTLEASGANKRSPGAEARAPSQSAAVVPPPLPPQELIADKGPRTRMQSSAGVVPPPLPPQEPSVDKSAKQAARNAANLAATEPKAVETRPVLSIPVTVDEDPPGVVSLPVLAARAAASAARESIDDTAKLRAVLEASLAPLQRTIAELVRRVEELERRPAAIATVPTTGLAPARSFHSIEVSQAGRARTPALSHHSLDVAAIERDTSIVIDGALNGRSRRMRLVLTLVFLLVAVFGVLGYALARSYAPH